MTPLEYKQLKAFARQDGALLSLLWIGAFVSYIQGLATPMWALVAMLLIIISPFYAANRLRHFRDDARDGIISFMRAYVYMVLTFFYAGLLLAAVLFVYFKFIDEGYLLGKFTQMIHAPESQQVLQMNGLKEQMSESLEELSQMRPIDYALNMLTLNIMTGFVLGLPIAFLMQRKAVNVKNDAM